MFHPVFAVGPFPFALSFTFFFTFSFALVFAFAFAFVSGRSRRWIPGLHGLREHDFEPEGNALLKSMKPKELRMIGGFLKCWSLLAFRMFFADV